MPHYDDIAQFLRWIQTLDPRHWLNEDDVETKFVLPLFQHLGYEDGFRHGKYPVPMYEREKPGRKPEIDQIYFSTDDPQKQNANTSLLIVECKEVGKIGLEAAYTQARFYGDRLHPPFLAVTNGTQLRVFKRHRFRDDEIVLDEPFAALREQATVEKLYKLLHFERVKQTKEELFDPYTHEQYVELMQAVKKYPLYSQLARGDFSPSTTRSGRDLTVVQPKAAMVCTLPLPFGEGHGRIEFSSLLLRGLTCHLTHQDIHQNLLVGLGTDPAWQTRSFLRQTEHHTFEARLGQSVVILSEDEAYDLCACIDIAGQAYKDSIIEAEDLLKTWGYEPVTQDDIHGFHILSVKPWLWELMLAFTREFDCFGARGKKARSAWHIFDFHYSFIRVCSNKRDPNIVIRPVAGNRFNSSEPGEYIDLLYHYWLDDSIIYGDGGSAQPSWRESIGPQGLWTAEHAKNWLTKQFIPAVLAYYNKPAQRESFTLQRVTDWLVGFLAPDALFAYKERLRQGNQERREAYFDPWLFDRSICPPLADLEVSNAKQLAEYVSRVQVWLVGYPAQRVEASLLRPYYAAFTTLAKRADPKSLEAQMDYLSGKLSHVGHSSGAEQDQAPEDDPLLTYADIVVNTNLLLNETTDRSFDPAPQYF